jgi:hypothetical protein
MVYQTVKQKLPYHGNFLARPPFTPRFVLGLLALLTFIFSMLPLPPDLVERGFSDAVFPLISAAFAPFADALPVAWLDVLTFLIVLHVIVSIYRRRWPRLVELAAAGYLVFFWSWGLNYHRQPLTRKLTLNPDLNSATAMESFVRQAAGRLNGLYPIVHPYPSAALEIGDQEVGRVARVVQVLDGTRWTSPRRVKTSILVQPWFRAAGIDGMFNPVVHEPVVNSNILDVERPFVIAHELAHVRGYPDEGEANFVALMATLMSDDARLQYSGWLHLWLYLRTRNADALLTEGPKQDIAHIFERMQRDEIRWLSNLQAAVLDWYLKANSVAEGVRSYSKIVLLAAGTQDSWNRFK